MHCHRMWDMCIQQCSSSHQEPLNAALQSLHWCSDVGFDLRAFCADEAAWRAETIRKMLRPMRPDPDTRLASWRLSRPRTTAVRNKISLDARNSSKIKDTRLKFSFYGKNLFFLTSLRTRQCPAALENRGSDASGHQWAHHRSLLKRTG